MAWFCAWGRGGGPLSMAFPSDSLGTGRLLFVPQRIRPKSPQPKSKDNSKCSVHNEAVEEGEEGRGAEGRDEDGGHEAHALGDGGGSGEDYQ